MLELMGHGVLDHPLLRVMTAEVVARAFSKTQLRIPAARFASGLCKNVSLSNRGRMECRVLSCTRSLVCKTKQANEHSHHRYAETIRHSLHDGFTAYSALSPGYRAC